MPYWMIEILLEHVHVSLIYLYKKKEKIDFLSSRIWEVVHFFLFLLNNRVYNIVITIYAIFNSFILHFFNFIIAKLIPFPAWITYIRNVMPRMCGRTFVAQYGNKTVQMSLRLTPYILRHIEGFGKLNIWIQLLFLPGISVVNNCAIISNKSSLLFIIKFIKGSPMEYKTH